MASFPDYEAEGINPPAPTHVLGGRADRGKTAPRKTWMKDVESGDWIEVLDRHDQHAPSRETFHRDANGNLWRLVDLGLVERVEDAE